MITDLAGLEQRRSSTPSPRLMPESYTYRYPRPMVTVDLVAFGLGDGQLKSLFVRRKGEPFAGAWAIPGGYLEMDEELEAAARRELKEETGLADLADVEEIGTFGKVGRDPRGRTISVAHAGIVRHGLPTVAGGDDAADARWLDPLSVSPLAFDHAAIRDRALDWLRTGLARGRFWFELLPPHFAKPHVEAILAIAAPPKKSAARWISSRLRANEIEPSGGKTYRATRLPG